MGLLAQLALVAESYPGLNLLPGGYSSLSNHDMAID